jgi:hypothetical protein
MSADRAENALEVRYLGKVVGWLNDREGDVRDVRVIKLDLDPEAEWLTPGAMWPSPSPIASGESHIFKIETVCWSIDAIRKASMVGDSYEQLVSMKTPPYAAVTLETTRDCERFTWAAVKLDTFLEYEWIFDYPQFVPADAPHDFTAEIETITKASPIFDAEEMRKMAEMYKAEPPVIKGFEPTGIFVDEASSISLDKWATDHGESIKEKWSRHTKPSEYISPSRLKSLWGYSLPSYYDGGILEVKGT